MSYADKSIWLHLSILRNELTGKSHFFEPFEEIISALKEKLL